MHRIWHVALLASVLLAVAGAVIVLLAPLIFDAPPPALARSKPVVFALVVVAGLLLAMEWLVGHERSL